MSENKVHNTKNIKLPKELTADLAEFIGAYLGDGTLTSYFIRISGDKQHDKPYFKYLTKLTHKLFSLNCTQRSENKTNQLYLEIRSKRLCDFLKDRFELRPGNKLKTGNKIPAEIMNNPELSAACLRGLIDTDGCIGKDGRAFTVRFCSHSQHLFNQVYKIGINLGVFSFKTKREIGTRSWPKINRYFKIVGSSNLRHIIRYNEYAKGNAIYKQDLIEYYSKYNKTNLPFYGPVVDNITS